MGIPVIDMDMTTTSRAVTLSQLAHTTYKLVWSHAGVQCPLSWTMKDFATISGVSPSVALRWDGDCIMLSGATCDGNPSGCFIGVTPAGYEDPGVLGVLPSSLDIKGMIASSSVRSAVANWGNILGLGLEELLCGSFPRWGGGTWAAFGDAALRLPAGRGEPRLSAGRQSVLVYNHTAVLCALATPVASTTPLPLPPTATPRPEVTATPRPEVTATPRPEVAATPTPGSPATPSPPASGDEGSGRTPTPTPTPTLSPTPTSVVQPSEGTGVNNDGRSGGISGRDGGGMSIGVTAGVVVGALAAAAAGAVTALAAARLWRRGHGGAGVPETSPPSGEHEGGGGWDAAHHAFAGHGWDAGGAGADGPSPFPTVPFAPMPHESRPFAAGMFGTYDGGTYGGGGSGGGNGSGSAGVGGGANPFPRPPVPPQVTAPSLPYVPSRIGTSGSGSFGGSISGSGGGGGVISAGDGTGSGDGGTGSGVGGSGCTSGGGITGGSDGGGSRVSGGFDGTPSAGGARQEPWGWPPPSSPPLAFAADRVVPSAGSLGPPPPLPLALWDTLPYVGGEAEKG